MQHTLSQVDDNYIVISWELIVIDNFVPYSNKHELSIIQGIQSSLNMMFLPLEEQGQQTNSSQISSPPENTQKQAILKSKQVLH